jgi:hypothetical protein
MQIFRGRRSLEKILVMKLFNEFLLSMNGSLSVPTIPINIRYT